jgi:hypothetical protein
VEVVSNKVLTSMGKVLGFAARSKAAAPAAKGVDIDVPENTAYNPLGNVERSSEGRFEPKIERRTKR